MMNDMFIDSSLATTRDYSPLDLRMVIAVNLSIFHKKKIRPSKLVPSSGHFLYR